MPIIPNTFNPTTNSFFRRYTPYVLPAGIVECMSMSDMVSFNMLPTDNTVINYDLGAYDEYRRNLLVKNLTADTLVRIYIEYDDIAFNIKRDGGDVQNPINEVILPGNTVTFIIGVNNAGLNNSINYLNKESLITITASNIVTGKLVTKNISTTELIPLRQPAIIDIT